MQTRISASAALVTTCALCSLVNVPLAHSAGGSKAFNPDIGVNVLGLINQDARGSRARTDALHNGILFQEGEVQFSADVDPYFRANALFSISQKDNSTDFGIDPEEVYIETLSLPVVTVRAGRLKTLVGKHNTLHTHAFPFIDAPLVNIDLFGAEGVKEMGISASALIPAPWFMELTAQGISTDNSKFFNAPDSGSYGGVGYFKNLWDLSDSTTLELGFFGTSGPNAFLRNSSAYGSDLIFKWRPVQGGKYHALIWQTEYLSGDIDGAAAPKLNGVASWVQYQFAERWWVQARGELEGLYARGSGGLGMKRRESALLGFFPSEFSGFRIQYDHQVADVFAAPDNRIAFQWNISIGAHPAHAY